MKLGFFITVRLKSTRLKKKVLLPLNGFSVIERVIQRASQVFDYNDIILCTSTNDQDKELINYANKSKIKYFLGHPDDVLQRLLDASKQFNITHFIGITADNPLFSIYHANLIKNLLIEQPSLDFVFTSGMPIGINIYGINVNALGTVCQVKEQIDTEIWGPLINRPDLFKVHELKVEQNYLRDNYRLTLDEEDDYTVINSIYKNFKKEEIINIIDVYDYLDNNPEIAELNTHVVQKELDPKIIKKIDDYYNLNRDKILKIKHNIYSNGI